MKDGKEAKLKYVLLTDGIVLTRRKFNSVKKKLKIANKTMNGICNMFEGSDDYIDELTYDTYLQWFADYHKDITKKYFDLIGNITNVVLKHFNDIDKTYTAKEVKDILSNNNIYNAEKGFGNSKGV